MTNYIDYDLQFSKGFLDPLGKLFLMLLVGKQKTNYAGGFLLMKDQNTIPDGESKKDKWNRGLDIFIESVIEPDPALRSCAHNQKCYHELMDVRQDVLEYLKTLRWN